MTCCVRALGPVRNGDVFEIAFSSDNTVNSTGFYATYHVLNASSPAITPPAAAAGRSKPPDSQCFAHRIAAVSPSYSRHTHSPA